MTDDVFDAMLAEQCVLGPHLICTKSEFREVVAKWCDQHNVIAPHDRLIRSCLERNGVVQYRPNRLSAWCWAGITCKV